MKLKLHISPCPNDTFMFHALIHRLVDVQGLEFATRLADIEELNASALIGEPDVSKISFGVYPELAEHYELLTAGSALGFGVGPLLVARRAVPPDKIAPCRVALPGPHTTAHLLFSCAFPSAMHKQHMLFSHIEGAVLSGEVDAGVIEAAKSMGASNIQIIFRVLLVEAKTSLMAGATITTGILLGYSAMSGTVGGGGLGDIAVRYGYYRWQTDIMIVTVVLLIVIFQIIQNLGSKITAFFDHRKK